MAFVQGHAPTSSMYLILKESQAKSTFLRTFFFLHHRDCAIIAPDLKRGAEGPGQKAFHGGITWVS